MKLKHLRYFVAITKTLSLNRAAASLGIAQPTLTRQIHVLERQLRVQLFARTNQGVSLTSAGATFLIGARRLLVLMAKTSKSLEPFRQATKCIE